MREGVLVLWVSYLTAPGSLVLRMLSLEVSSGFSPSSQKTKKQKKKKKQASRWIGERKFPLGVSEWTGVLSRVYIHSIPCQDKAFTEDGWMDIR